MSPEADVTVRLGAVVLFLITRPLSAFSPADPRSCRATDCGDIQIMWLSDNENVENHVALTGRYAGHAA